MNRIKVFTNAVLPWLPYCVLLVTAFLMFSTSVDDPFITFRYAANLLAGHGPVFNVGERVEADTSPLHMLICALLLKLPVGTGMLFKAKLFSLIIAILVLFQMSCMGRILSISNEGIIFCQTLAALNVNFVICAVNGLETSLYGLLVIASLTAFINECSQKRGATSAVLLFLSLLARPETVALAAALFVLRLVRVKVNGLPIRFLTTWAATFVIPAIVLFAARYAYYRQIFPNTYYAKAGIFIPANGIHYLMHPLTEWTPHFSLNLSNLLFVPFWSLVVIGALTERRNWSVVSLSVVSLATCVCVMRSDGDWMPGWRFMIPVLPALLFLQYFGLQSVMAFFGLFANAPRIGSKFPSGPHSYRYLYCAVAAAAAWIFASCPHSPLTISNESITDRGLLLSGYTLGPTWVQSADFIRDEFHKGDYIAYSEMGYAGYTNLDKRFLDTRGLTDNELCKLYPSSYKSSVGITDKDWYDQRSPLYTVLVRRHPDAILSFDFSGEPPLGVLGDYTLLATLDGSTSDSLKVIVYVPTRN